MLSSFGVIKFQWSLSLRVVEFWGHQVSGLSSFGVEFQDCQDLGLSRFGVVKIWGCQDLGSSTLGVVEIWGC